MAVKDGVMVGVTEGVGVTDGVSVAVGLRTGFCVGAAAAVAVSGGRLIDLT